MISDTLLSAAVGAGLELHPAFNPGTDFVTPALPLANYPLQGGILTRNWFRFQLDDF